LRHISKHLMVPVFSAGIVLLSSCSSQPLGISASSSVPATPAPVESAVPSEQNSPASEPSATISPSDLNDAEVSSTPADTKPTVTAQPRPKLDEVPPSPVEQTYLQEIMENARKGKVRSSEFTVRNTQFNQIEAKLGKPTSFTQAGYGYYASYGRQSLAFGYNMETGVVFDVRSYEKKLQNLTLPMIKKELGEPSDIRKFKDKNHDDTIYVYQAGEQYELKFIIPSNTGRVDHISVFSRSGVR
jgi:Domain of unknown function (DUF4309)